VETAWLVIFGRLPTQADADRFSDLLTESSMLPRSILKHFNAFPRMLHRWPSCPRPAETQVV
jgi:citrate synthase